MNGGVQICFYFHHYSAVCAAHEWSSLFRRSACFVVAASSFLLASVVCFLFFHVVCLPLCS